MGDTGSLSMGGTIGAIAVANMKLYWLLFRCFVLEALSIIAEVVSFKLTGKDFRWPIHHHFEQKGWSDQLL